MVFNLPLQHLFRDSKTAKGFLFERNVLAAVFGVPVEHVHHFPRRLTMNPNDMICIYSTDQQFKTIGREKGLVLKVDGTGLHGAH
jgi:hypothetical protein